MCSNAVQTENHSLSATSSIINVPNSSENMCSNIVLTDNHIFSSTSSKTNVHNSLMRMRSDTALMESHSLSKTPSVINVPNSSESLCSNMVLTSNQSFSTTSSITYVHNISESKRSSTVLTGSHKRSMTSSITNVPNPSEIMRSDTVQTGNHNLSTTSFKTYVPNSSECMRSYTVLTDDHTLTTTSSITYSPKIHVRSNQLDCKTPSFLPYCNDKDLGMLYRDVDSPHMSYPTIANYRSNQGSICNETTSTYTSPSTMQIEEHNRDAAISIPYAVDAQSTIDDNSAWHNYENPSVFSINKDLRKSPRRTSHPSFTLLGAKNASFGNETPSIGANTYFKKSPRRMMTTQKTIKTSETSNNNLGMESPSASKQRRSVDCNLAIPLPPCEPHSPSLDNTNLSSNRNKCLRRSPRRMNSPFSSTPAKTKSYENMLRTNPNEPELDHWYYNPPTPAMTSYNEILISSPRRSPRNFSPSANTGNSQPNSNKHSRTKLTFEVKCLYK